MFKIEKTKMPMPRNGHGKYTEIRETIEKLQVGESFVIPNKTVRELDGTYGFYGIRGNIFREARRLKIKVRTMMVRETGDLRIGRIS